LHAQNAKKKISDSASTCPNCGYQLTQEKIAEIKKKEQQAKKGWAIGCLSLIAIFLVLYLSGFFSSPESLSSRSGTDTSTERIEGSATPAPQPAIPAQTKPDAPMPTYYVVDHKKVDNPIKTQYVLHAVVSGTLTELGLKQLLRTLYDKANATGGFRYHGGKPTVVGNYLYTSQELFETGMAQWIAMLSKSGEGSQIFITVKTNLIAQAAAKPEVKYGRNRNVRRFLKHFARLNHVLTLTSSACIQFRHPSPYPKETQIGRNSLKPLIR
jgi:hypothetical protein